MELPLNGPELSCRFKLRLDHCDNISKHVHKLLHGFWIDARPQHHPRVIHGNNDRR